MSATKDALKNPTLVKRLAKRKAKLDKSKGVKKTIKVATKSPPEGSNQEKMRVNPSCLTNRGLNGAVVAEAARKMKVCPPTASRFPTLRDDKAQPILSTTCAFGDVLLVGRLNRIDILLEDYDVCVALDEK